MDSNQSTQAEKIFYQDNNVVVTQSRFVSSGKTHAMRNISSVSNCRIVKSKSPAIVLCLIGIIAMFIGGKGIIFGVIFLGLGIAIFATTKDDFSVRINSNSGETNGLISKDQNYVQKIVEAVNEAIIHRG
jgi:hypothetical protein